MVDTVFKLLLLFSPIAYSTGISLNKFDTRFFEIGTLALYAASLFDAPKRSLGSLHIYIALLIGLLVANSLIHKFQPMDIRAVECMFFAIICFAIVVTYLRDYNSCYKYIFWALGINLVVLVGQHIGYAPMISTSRIGHAIACEGGMIGNISLLGIYLALTMSYLPIGLMAILALIFGLLIHHSQLCVFIPLVITIYFKAKNMLWRVLVGLAGLGTLYVFHDKILASVLLRWQIWKPTLEMIFERPLLGWGFGTYGLWNGAETFSLYLPFAYGVGLLGLVWMGWLIRDVIRHFRPNTATLAVISLLLLSVVEYPFDLPRLWFTIVFILTCYVIQRQEDEDASGLSRA